MVKIVFTSVLLFVVVGYVAFIFFSFFSKKMKGEAASLKGSLIKLLVAGCLFIFLSGYNVYLIFGLVDDNKDDILGAGQKAISSTVEYGTTAVVEGLGATVDHFEKKWDKEYKALFDNVHVSVIDVAREKMNDKQDKLLLNVLFDNSNSDKIDINYLSNNECILLLANDSLYYPASLSDIQTSHYLPKGKTTHFLQCVVPKGTQVYSLRVFDTEIRLAQ